MRRLKSFRRLSHPQASSARFWQSLEYPRATATAGEPDAGKDAFDLSSRQLAAWITDNKGFSVSESSVYRLLKSQGLIKSPEMKMAAGKEFHTKATRPHQMWATDASYFRVCGWGFYYLVTVMDDFSRFIIAWRLQRDMTSDSFIEVVQDAVDLIGMTDVPRNLEVVMTEFVNYNNNRRYHKAMGNVTPSDVLDGRSEEIMERRKGFRLR